MTPSLSTLQETQTTQIHRFKDNDTEPEREVAFDSFSSCTKNSSFEMCGICSVVENGDRFDLISHYWVRNEYICFLRDGFLLFLDSFHL